MAAGGHEELIHASAIALDGRAALIRGPSGSGKSDLALRCLATPAFACPAGGRVHLLADDYVEVFQRDGALFGRAPAALAGRLEVRGLGIFEVDAVGEARVVLVADLVAPGTIERLPDPPDTVTVAGVCLPLVRLAAFEASAAAKLVLALTKAGN